MTHHKTPISNILLLAIVAIIPIVHATAFTRADDLRTPLYLALATILLLFSPKSRNGVLSIRIVTLVSALYIFAQLLFRQQLGDHWAVYSTAPIVASLALIAARSDRSNLLNYSAFSTAVSVGVFGTALFAFLQPFHIYPFMKVWEDSTTFGAFDSREVAAPYFGIATMLTAYGAIAVKSKLRYVIGAASLLAAFLLGTYPGQIFALLPLIIFLIFFPLVGWVMGRKNEIDNYQSLRKMNLQLVAFGVALILVFGAGHYLFMENAPNRSHDDSYLIGDRNWASSIPSISPDNNPIYRGTSLDTEFSTGRWEMVTDQKELAKLFNIGAEHLQQQPLVGTGPNSWWNNQSDDYRVHPEWVPRDTQHYAVYRTLHNGFLQLAVEFGITGAILLILLIFLPIATTTWYIKRLDRSAVDPEKWFTITGLIFSLFVGLWMSAITPLYQTAAPMMLLAATISMLVTATPHPKPDNDDSTSHYGVLNPLILPIFAVALYTAVFSAPAVKANYWRGLADTAMLHRQYANAANFYTKANDEAPEGTLIYNSIVARKRNFEKIKPDEAIKLLDRAIELRPYDSRILNLKSDFLLLTLRSEDAIKTLDLAILYNPNAISAYQKKASILTNNLAFSNSIATLQAAVNRKPPDALRSTLYQLMGNTALDLAQDYANAVKYFKLAKMYRPDDVSLELVQDLKRATALEKIDHLKREGKQIPQELLRSIQDHHHH